MTNKFFLIVLVLIVTILGSSCSKESTIDNTKISLLQQHTWVLDSTHEITDSYQVMQAENPVSLYNFYPDSLIVKFHSINRISLSVSYQAPAKVYAWLPGEVKSENEYMLIANIDNLHLILNEIDVLSNRTRVRYLHAQ